MFLSSRYVSSSLLVLVFIIFVDSFSAVFFSGSQGRDNPSKKSKPAPQFFPKRREEMEESFADDLFFPSNWDYFAFILVRPIFAVVFTLSVLSLGWLLAWKLVLPHVPLVQEIFGLHEKTIRPKPGGRRRFTQFYNRINAPTPTLEWVVIGMEADAASCTSGPGDLWSA